MEHCIIKADFSATRTVAGRKVQQLIFEVAIEDADDVLAKLGGFPHPGKSQPCAIALLDETKLGQEAETPSPAFDPKGDARSLDSASTSSSEPASGSPKKPWSEYTRSQQSAIMCGDPDFQRYFGALSDTAATEKLRAHFRISSRRDLDLDGMAQRWDEFVAIYHLHRDRLR